MEQSVMEAVYEKIKAPYKFGSVLKFEDFYCDSPVVFRYGNRFLMSFVKIDKQNLTGYTTHLAESSDLPHWTKWEEEPLVFCEYDRENVHAHKRG